MRAYKVYLLIYTYIDGIVRRNNIVKKKKTKRFNRAEEKVRQSDISLLADFLLPPPSSYNYHSTPSHIYIIVH